MTTRVDNTKPDTTKPRSVNRLAAYFAAKNGKVSESAVDTAGAAREVVRRWLRDNFDGVHLELGLPEVDDRYEAWRVALLDGSGEAVGEVMIRCRDGEIVQATKPGLIRVRLFNAEEGEPGPGQSRTEFTHTTIGDSAVVCGDARIVLRQLPENFFGLVITSPPYYNAKPEYSEYSNYSEYLSLLEDVFKQCHRTLQEGRFLIVNASPVLVRRPSRNRSSKRIPVPFHINGLLEEIGFEFIDDIIWAKPAGAGWNTGRGRRFAADRHPLQYKPVPVTEYFLVYRKETDKLIDWNIRTHSDQEAVRASRIQGEYEVTNVWYARPSHHPEHPAVFPVEIIEKLIRYYSFKNDLVLDPFAGLGTVGRAALRAGRRFFLIDTEQKYCEIAIQELDGGFATT
ncbi:MAG: site-specific DNA-methyltransferase [Chloroflexi bacterium]|nr:site-specific DNA-methyltransferase [Chloroflexota bacterium]